jgi:predicted N-acetyltransferase YhbS
LLVQQEMPPSSRFGSSLTRTRFSLKLNGTLAGHHAHALFKGSIMKTPAFTIRWAIPGDDPRIGELLIESFVSSYAKKMPDVIVTETRKADLRNVAPKRESHCVLVAERAGEILGTVSLFRAGDSASRAWMPNTADLRYLAIDPRAQGQGLSKPLLDAAVEIAREWKASAICLHVRRGATGVAGVYSKYGFSRSPEGDVDLLPEISAEAFLKLRR